VDRTSEAGQRAWRPAALALLLFLGGAAVLAVPYRHSLSTEVPGRVPGQGQVNARFRVAGQGRLLCLLAGTAFTIRDIAANKRYQP
jgi:hypothetical protein